VSGLVQWDSSRATARRWVPHSHLVTTNGAVANYQSVIVTIKTIQISPTAGAFALTNSKDTHHNAQKQVLAYFSHIFLLHETKHQSYLSTARPFRNYGQLLILNACLARSPVALTWRNRRNADCGHSKDGATRGGPRINARRFGG
jgi:hypothetical protein